MKRAVIIGASSGIGREVALSLLAEGWSVGVAARREEKLRALEMTAPERVSVAVIDICAEDAPRRLFRLIERTGGIDLFFLASGIGFYNPALDSAKEMETVSTDVLGFTRVITAAYNYMSSHGGGHIAAITSIAGTKGLGAAPAYSAAKAFDSVYLEALSQLGSIRRRQGGEPSFSSVTITDIRPGFVDTALLAGHRFPLTMKPAKVARAIVRAIHRRRSVVIIDWRWRLITAAWRVLPHALWRRMSVR